VNNEKFQALYKNTKKEEIIEELYYKCKANNELVSEIERLNNIIENMEEELMTIYLDIMEYNEDYAKREIKKLKGVDKND
jgi:hypothetical protein